MKKEDPVREFLREAGAASHVVEGGLAGLLDAWEKIGAEVSRGYAADLDDYLNDMDLRQLLEDALAAASTRERERVSWRLATLDAAMRVHLVPAVGCLWGRTVAAGRELDAERNWWYFLQPRNPGASLARDIARRVRP